MRRTPARSPRRLAAALTVLAVVSTACSGGDDDTAPITTTAPPVTTAVASEPAAPTSTTAVPPSTTAAPTTTAATTTLAPADVEAQIRADFDRTMALYYECVYEPETCRFDEIGIPDSPIDLRLNETVNELIGQGFRGARDSGPTFHVVEGVEIIDPGRALVTACVTDGAVLMAIGDPADPMDDAIWNDLLISTRGEWDFRRRGENWYRFDTRQIAQFPEAESCA